MVILVDSAFIFLPLLIIVVYFYIQQKSKYNKLSERFKNVTDIDSEISKENRKLEEIRAKINETDIDYKNRRDAYEKTLKDFKDLSDIQSAISKN